MSTLSLRAAVPAVPATAPRFEPPSQSFAAVIRRALGEQWGELEPAIARRFATPLEHVDWLSTGSMQWVYCSPLGALIARLLRPAGVLPDICTRQAGFSFRIRLAQQLTKLRVYEFGSTRFLFKSVFREQPELHEEFACGLGMYLRLSTLDGSLVFRDAGYFLRLGVLRIRLPALLTLGRFELIHRNIDERHFQVIIRIAHPLLGTLFYQRGEFCTEDQAPKHAE